MEEKTFELLEKMYVEFSEFRKETNTRLDNVEGHITRIENEHGQKLDALFDGYKQTYEKLQEHDKRFDEHDKRFVRIEAKLDNLSLKVNNHDSKLEILEGGRKK